MDKNEYFALLDSLLEQDVDKTEKRTAIDALAVKLAAPVFTLDELGTVSTKVALHTARSLAQLRAQCGPVELAVRVHAMMFAGLNVTLAPQTTKGDSGFRRFTNLHKRVTTVRVPVSEGVYRALEEYAVNQGVSLKVASGTLLSVAEAP